jgi:hypothetical protein
VRTLPIHQFKGNGEKGTVFLCFYRCCFDDVSFPDEIKHQPKVYRKEETFGAVQS